MLKNAALMHMKKKKKKEEPPPPTPAAVDKKEEESVEPNSLIDYSNVEIDESPPPSPPPPAPKEIPLSEMPSVDYGDDVTSPPPKELEATVDMDPQQEKDAGFEVNSQAVVSPTSVADAPIVVDFDPFQIDAEQQAKKSVVFLEDDDDSHGEFILHSVSNDATDDMVYPGKKTEEDIDTPPAGTHKKIGGSSKKEGRPSVTVITPERKDRERARSSSSRPRARSSSRHRDVEDDRRRSSSRGARRNSGGGGGGLFSCGDFDDDISDTFKLITQPLKNFKRCGPNETEAVVKDIKRGTLVKDFQRGTYAIEEYLTDRLTEFRENQKRRAEAYERRRMEFENWRREREEARREKEEARRERERSRRSIGGGGSRGRRSSRRDDEYDKGSSRRSYSASKSYDYPDDESLRRGGSDLVTERRAMV